MSVAAIGLLGVTGLLVLLFARVPIALALAGMGLMSYAALDGWPKALKMFGLVPYQLASAYSLSVIPLFILMGAVAARANMATELFQASNAVFSGIRGALANATIGACALFGAICGSSIATAATFSKVAIPEMRRHGYEAAFAAGAVASAGTLDVLIPPSVLLAIYAIIAEQSLPKLYAAAFVPGFILAALYVVTVLAVAWARPAWIPNVAAMPLATRLRAAVGMWKLGVLFFFAVVGIYLGWFSPTEAAAVAAFVAILIAFATGAMGWRGLIDALLETAYTTAAIFFIVVGAFIFSRFVVLTQVPNELARWVQAVGLSPFWILTHGEHALLPARHVPRRGEHHPHHRPSHAAARHRHRLRRHLVRDLRHRDVYDRLDQPAHGHDGVRHPGPAPGDSGGTHLPRHAAVPRRGFRPRGPLDRHALHSAVVARIPKDVAPARIFSILRAVCTLPGACAMKKSRQHPPAEHQAREETRWILSRSWIR